MASMVDPGEGPQDLPKTPFWLPLFSRVLGTKIGSARIFTKLLERYPQPQSKAQGRARRACEIPYYDDCTFPPHIHGYTWPLKDL